MQGQIQILQLKVVHVIFFLNSQCQSNKTDYWSGWKIYF